MTAAEIWSSIWEDVTTRLHPEARTVLLALGAVVVLLALPALWRTVRHALTMAHETGHAVVATLTGRRVSGIRLHSDTSGLTMSTGDSRRWPLALTAFAGYPAPAVLGLAIAFALHQGFALAVLWALVAAMLLVLVRIRNLFGFAVMVVTIVGVGAAAWFLPDAWRTGLAYAIAWLMLAGAVRDVMDLGGLRRRGAASGSDADVLARLTRIPGVVWVVLFWIVTVACAGLGAWLMLKVPH